ETEDSLPVLTLDRALIEDHPPHVRTFVYPVKVIRGKRGDDVDGSSANRSPVRAQRVEIHPLTQVVDLVIGHAQADVPTVDAETGHPFLVVEHLGAIADKAIDAHVLGP